MELIEGIYEAHLPVRDLDRALAFYTDRLGLTLGTVDEEQQGALLLIDTDRRSMLGLWVAPDRVFADPSPRTGGRHTAFQVPSEAIGQMVAGLEARGIEIADRFGPQPLVHAWMPAASVYFEDPDGNLLELIADLPGPPRPELGSIPLEAWKAATGASTG